MPCLDTTKYYCCATNAHFQKKKDEISVWKAWKFVAYCVPSSKEPFEGENAFAVCVPFSLFRSRKNVLYFESSLLTYLHIPSVFHNERPGFLELYSKRNVDFTLKNHCPTRTFFDFFGVAVRFGWIKIDVWLKLGVFNYLSRPKLSLGSAHVKYGVWPWPNLRKFSVSFQGPTYHYIL